MALACAGPFAAAQSFERQLPEDVILSLSLKDYPDFMARFKETPHYDLLLEPEIEGFFSGMLEMTPVEDPDELISKVKSIAGRVDAMLSGEVAMALGELLLSPYADPEVQFILLADVTEHRDRAERLIEELLDMVRTDMPEAEITRSEESFRGTAIVQISVEGDEEELYYALDDETLAVCVGGRSLLEKHIVLRQGGDVPSLADAPLYRQLQAFFGPNEDGLIFLNIAALIDMLPAAGEAPPGQFGPPVGPRDILDMTGLTDIEAFGISARLMEDGTRNQALLLVPAPRRGLLRAFVPQEADPTPVPFVDEKVALYSGLYFDIPTFWQEIMNLVGQVNPMAYQMLQFQLNNPQLGIDIENDLINAMGGRWVVYMPGEIVTPNPPPMLNLAMTVELVKPEAFERALQQILAGAAQGAEEPAQIEYMGRTIYQFPIPPFVAADSAVGVEPHLVVLDDKLVLAMNLSLAKRIIQDSQRGQSPLLANEEFARARRHVIEDPHGLTYVDNRLINKWRWEQMGPAMEQGGQELPDWQVVQKYQTVSIMAMKWITDGLWIESWEPFPEVTD